MGIIKGYLKWFGLGLCILAHSVSASERSLGLRGARYCEIMYLEHLQLEIYATLALNNCPDPLWQQLSASQIKAVTHASYVHLNGPKRLIADGVSHPYDLNPKPKTFQGLKTYKVGVLHPSSKDYLEGETPYREHHIQRQSIWVYAAGKSIYELIDPEGQVYLMYAYSLSTSQQSEQDLKLLGQKMMLPKHWRFQTGILSQETQVKPFHHESIVIEDERRNAYHKIPKNLLSSLSG